MAPQVTPFSKLDFLEQKEEPALWTKEPVYLMTDVSLDEIYLSNDTVVFEVMKFEKRNHRGSYTT